MERTVSITITVDPKEEMFSVEAIEGESGCTSEFGPTPLWSDCENALKDKVGNEIISWVKLMMEEAEECEDDE